MKTPLNEIKRMQRLAGILKEGMEDWGNEKDDYGNSEEDYSPEPSIEDFDYDQEAYEAAYQYWLKKKKGSSEVKEYKLGPKTDENIEAAIEKELEEKFGKYYFIRSRYGNDHDEFTKWKEEKAAEYGDYDARMALAGISNKQREDALEQIEDIMVSYIPKLGWKNGKFSTKSPAYKEMEAAIHDKLGIEKGLGLDDQNVLNNENGKSIMYMLIRKHWPRK
jgi:hypothetical protein